MADGHLNKCKECTKQDVRTNRQNNLDYYRTYDRKRGNRQSPEYMRKYRKEHPEVQQRYRENNPEKYDAHLKINNAVRDGIVKKLGKCEKCGTEAHLEAHHDDYTKPLEVTWLCPKCHGLTRRKYCPFCNEEIKGVFGHNCPDWEDHHK